MINILLVAAGGALGSMARYVLSGFVQRAVPAAPFLGTLGVNVLGCLAIGIVAQCMEDRNALSPQARAFVLVGVLGGFTTFSAFANETVDTARAGDVLVAAANVAAHVVLGLGAVWCGRALVRLAVA